MPIEMNEKLVRGIYRKSLVVFAGLPLTGKTTLARELSYVSNYDLLDVDVVRRQSDPVIKVLIPEEEKKAVEQTYIKIFQLAKRTIENNNPVIISGVFSRPDPYHHQLKNFVKELEIPLRFFYLEPPGREELEKRIKDRKADLENLSNVTSFDRFLEVESRYKLIENINVIHLPAELSIEKKNSLVKKNLEDLKLN